MGDGLAWKWSCSVVSNILVQLCRRLWGLVVTCIVVYSSVVGQLIVYSPHSTLLHYNHQETTMSSPVLMRSIQCCLYAVQSSSLTVLYSNCVYVDNFNTRHHASGLGFILLLVAKVVYFLMHAGDIKDRSCFIAHTHYCWRDFQKSHAKFLNGTCTSHPGKLTTCII